MTGRSQPRMRAGEFRPAVAAGSRRAPGTSAGRRRAARLRSEAQALPRRTIRRRHPVASESCGRDFCPGVGGDLPAERAPSDGPPALQKGWRYPPPAPDARATSRRERSRRPRLHRWSVVVTESQLLPSSKVKPGETGRQCGPWSPPGRTPCPIRALETPARHSSTRI